MVIAIWLQAFREEPASVDRAAWEASGDNATHFIWRKRVYALDDLAGMTSRQFTVVCDEADIGAWLQQLLDTLRS